MQVFELKQQPQLLAGSNQVGATRDGYGAANEVDWD